MRTNLFKRTLALCLLLVMLLSVFSVAAMAADMPAKDWKGGTVNVYLVGDNPDETVTITLYKIISVNSEGTSESSVNQPVNQPADPEYTWLGNTANANDSLGQWVMTNENSIKNGVSEFSRKVDRKDVKTDAPYYYYEVLPGFHNPTDENFLKTRIAAFYDQLELAIEDNQSKWKLPVKTVTCKKSELTATPDGYAYSFGEMEMGAYLVTVTGDSSVYTPTVAVIDPFYNENKASGKTEDRWYISNPAEVKMKGVPISVTKKVAVADKTDPAKNPSKDELVDEVNASMDDLLFYQIEALIPEYKDNIVWQKQDGTPVRTFEITDTMTGQDLIPSSITIKVSKTEDGKETVKTICYVEDNAVKFLKDTPFTVEVNGTDLAAYLNNPGNALTKTLDIRMNTKKVYTEYLRGYDKVIVTYKTRVDQSAILKDGTESFSTEQDSRLQMDNANVVKLHYSNDPYVRTSAGKDLEDMTKFYTYGIKITKYDAEDDTLTLKGAEFNLTGKDGVLTFVKDGTSGYYLREDAKDSTAAPGDGQQKKTPSATLITDENGMIKIKGLAEGDYVLTEIKANPGYSKNTTPVTITIRDKKTAIYDDSKEFQSNSEGMDGKPEEADDKGPYTDCLVPQKFTNTRTFALPESGGMGTVLYTMIGIALMAGGILLVVVFLRRRRG